MMHSAKEEVANFLQSQSLQTSKLHVGFRLAQQQCTESFMEWVFGQFHAPNFMGTVWSWPLPLPTWLCTKQSLLRARPSHPTSLCDLTNALLQEWSKIPINTPKPCGQPSQKSWSFHSCKGWADVMLNPRIRDGMSLKLICKSGQVSEYFWLSLGSWENYSSKHLRAGKLDIIWFSRQSTRAFSNLRVSLLWSWIWRAGLWCWHCFVVYSGLNTWNT